MLDVNRLLTQVMSAGLPGPDHGDESRNRPPQAQSSASATPVAGSHTPWVSSSVQPASTNFGNVGALGASALAGGFAGLLLSSKRMRDMAGTAAQIGAVAAIGGLAYKAYQNYRQGQPVVPQSINDLFSDTRWLRKDSDQRELSAWIPPQGRTEDVSKLLLQTMVAAATADGHLDDVEHAHIRRQLATSALSEEEQRFLSWTIKHPATIAELAGAATTPELKAEVYAAARLAIEPDSPTERDWLERLAAALKLEPRLKAHLDALGATRHAQAA